MAQNPSPFRLLARFSALAGTAAIALSAGTATAQQAAAGGLEEVVVTARRVEEKLQTTPIAVSALPAEALRALDITRIQGLDTVVPNLIIGDAPSNGLGTIVYIRGVGAISVSAYSDPPIGIYIDGVVQARPVGNASDLPDFDRVEVLRGPQGTLFGRNTTGGAVAVYTKKPTQESGGTVELGYGNYNEINASGSVNTGEIAGLGLRTKFSFLRHTYDGFATTPGRKKGKSNGYYGATAYSFAFAKDFGDKLTFDNRAFYDKTEAKPFYQVVVAGAVAQSVFGQSQARGGTPFLVDANPLDLNYLDPRTSAYDPFAKSWGDTATLTYDASEYLTVKSITGYRKLIQQQTGQLGGSVVYGPVGTLTNIQPVQFATVKDEVSQHQFSEELQATGTAGEFNYVAGFYYFHERINEDQRTITGTPLATGLVTLTDAEIVYSLPSTSYAGYANLGWKPAALDDRLELTGGIRYTQDRKKENAIRIANGVFQGPQLSDNKWHNYGWSGSLSYQWTSDAMTYVRYSSAYRAGGFNPSQIGAPAFNPEKARTLEGGFKTEWFDRMARLNGAVFKTWYNDLQINQRNAQTATSIVVNAGKATYTGYELEGVVVLGGGFQVNGTVGYVDPKYKEYLFRDASGAPLNIADVARFPMVSKWTYNIGGRYKSEPTPLGVVTLNLNYSFQSSHYFQPVDSLAPNNAANPSGPQRNLKGSLVLSELPFLENQQVKDVSIQLYGDNLLNKRYRLSFVDFATYGTAAFNRPRSYGVKVRGEF